MLCTRYPKSDAMRASIRQILELTAACDAKSFAQVLARQGHNEPSEMFGDLNADRRRKVILVLDMVLCLSEQVKEGPMAILMDEMRTRLQKGRSKKKD
jgi:hypothetical protein